MDGRSSPPWYPAALLRADGARAPYGEHAVKPAHVRQGWVQGRGVAGDGAAGFRDAARPAGRGRVSGRRAPRRGLVAARTGVNVACAGAASARHGDPVYSLARGQTRSCPAEFSFFLVFFFRLFFSLSPHPILLRWRCSLLRWERDNFISRTGMSGKLVLANKHWEKIAVIFLAES